ncbi:MAG TPA: hypothetical protein VLW25_00155 [Bryobacteraceae bacterium]|nr:hypothetical protein [Bryobacteraceae bacterium]
MNPLFAQYTPFFLAVIAVGLGVIYSNSRITDIKDLIRAENNALRAEILRVEGTLRADLAGLDRRMMSLEQRMDRFEIRMDGLEHRMDRVESRMDNLEKRMDRFERERFVRS